MTSKPLLIRVVHRNILLSQIVGYRLPAAGVVSIFHRLSGALMFLAMPFIVWLFDSSVSSEGSYAVFAQAFGAGLGVVPGWLFKLVVWALIGAYFFHLIAGCRHLWMDVTHRVSMEQGRASALFTLIASAVLWLPMGAKLFGLY
jgi:succinate dehydrogenase / fumarate reductase cytochrome b subunit